MTYPKLYTKELIAELLDISSRTLRRDLGRWEKDILEKFPDYNKKCKRLTPSQFRYILNRCQFDDTEIDKIIECYRNKKTIPFEDIKANFGL